MAGEGGGRRRAQGALGPRLRKAQFAGWSSGAKPINE